MKVKSVESVVSGSELGVRGSELHPIGTPKPQARTRNLIIILLLVAFAMSQAVVGTAVAAFDGDKKSTEKLHRDAKKALRKGEFQKAQEIYNNLLAIDAKDAQARLGAAMAYLKAQDFLNCYNYALELNKQNPNNARAHALAGLALLRSGYIRTAIVELRQALEL